MKAFKKTKKAKNKNNTPNLAEQSSRFLMPGAPERGRKRKMSPTRIPPPLKPGVPPVPPPRVPQSWKKAHKERKKDGDGDSGPSSSTVPVPTIDVDDCGSFSSVVSSELSSVPVFDIGTVITLPSMDQEPQKSDDSNSGLSTSVPKKCQAESAMFGKQPIWILSPSKINRLHAKSDLSTEPSSAIGERSITNAPSEKYVPLPDVNIEFLGFSSETNALGAPAIQQPSSVPNLDIGTVITVVPLGEEPQTADNGNGVPSTSKPKKRQTESEIFTKNPVKMLGPKKKSKTLQAESDCSSETGSASEESSIITNSSTEKDSACSDANVEFVGVSPQSSSRISPAPAIQHLDPLDDDDDDAVERWVQSVDTNPGSDTEDNDINESTSNHNENFRSALGCPADIENYLNQETCNDLNEIDMRADAELREIAADTDLLSFEWSNDPNVFTGKRETFTGKSGPTFSTKGMSPLDVFRRIWDDAIIDLIVLETNRYAHQCKSKADLGTFSRIKKWKDIDRNDLWSFLAVLMLESIVPLPVEREFWYPCLPYLKLGDFSQIMPFDKFILMKKCLHFVNNKNVTHDTDSDGQKLFKIKPIIDHLSEKFSSLYIPEQNIALDESLLLWKGKLSFAQMISNKAAKVGIKSYELCESRTGYLWSFLIYGGKKYAGCTKFASDIDEPERATAKIVYTLVRPLLNRGHTLVMDNFYNAPLLTRMLKKEKTDTMGTLRLNREFVPHSLKAIKKTDFRVGEVAFSHAKDMTILVWRDSNLVSLISSYHKIEVSGKEKHGIYRHKPQVVLDYNLSMGGVDKKDQMLQAFPIERVRNVVWYKKLFRRLFNVSIYNAYVIYNATRNNVSQRKFRVQLADEILKKFGQPVKVTPNAPRILEGHFPTKGKSSKATCKVCYKKKRDTRTAYQCDNCKVALCIIGCFREFHTLTENDLRRNSDEVGFLRL